MAYNHELTITDRIRVVPSAEIGDGSTKENVIEAVVCIARCTDEETGEIASSDPWVTLDLTDLTAENFVEYDTLTALPDRAVTQLTQWGKDQEEGLEAQLAERMVASKEQVAPWV